MQAVILAAGEGKRMLPLTTPKPLLRVGNVPLIARLVHQLKEANVKDFLIVCSPKSETPIRSLLPHATIVIQETPKGTGDALLKAAPHLQHEFFVVNGDEWYTDNPFPQFKGHGMAISRVPDISRFGAVQVKNKKIVSIEEKPQKAQEGWVNAGAYKLTNEIIADLRELTPSRRGEIELVAVLSSLDLDAIPVSWTPLSYPWDLLQANEHALTTMTPSQEGRIEDGAVLKGTVRVGKDTIIRSGAYIEGPVVIGERCVIGPNCFIRPFTTIGNDCKVGNAVEIKNSILGDHVAVSHLSYVGDSIIGNNVNLGAGTIVANLRHDHAHVHVRVAGKKIDTGRKKFGCIIADNVHTGIHTSIYPGRVLSDNTLPGQIVR